MNKFFQNSQEYLRGLFLAIQEAKKDIYFTAYAISYFQKAQPLSVKQIIEELIEAKKRGVKVFGVVNTNLNLPYLEKQTLDAMQELIQGDCEVKAFPKARILHAKIFVIDNYLIFIGSQNLTEVKGSGQVEMSIAIEDSLMAGLMKSYIALLGTIQEEETT